MILTDRVRCMNCGCEFNRGKAHPVHLVYLSIYDYPSICRNFGRRPNLIVEGELPWVMSVINEV